MLQQPQHLQSCPCPGPHGHPPAAGDSWVLLLLLLWVPLLGLPPSSWVAALLQQLCVQQLRVLAQGGRRPDRRRTAPQPIPAPLPQVQQLEWEEQPRPRVLGVLRRQGQQSHQCYRHVHQAVGLVQTRGRLLGWQLPRRAQWSAPCRPRLGTRSAGEDV